MYERILVPLDGSRIGEIVLPYVAEISAKLGSEINLASVTEAHAVDVNHLYRSYLEQIKVEVQRKVNDYGREEAKVFWKILLGKPADEILQYTDEVKADLIVMASRGSSGEGPWLLGNIAAKVLRATTQSVLLVRAPASEAAVQEKRVVKKILLPLDGSKVSETAIPYTTELALALDTELVLFQVVQPYATIGSPEVEVPYSQPIVDENRRISAEKYLNNVRDNLKQKGLRTSSVVALGSAAEQIIDYAEAHDIDVIAMSSHGGRGIGRWVFGSVTNKVLHTGDTATLVVRATKT